MNKFPYLGPANTGVLISP